MISNVESGGSVESNPEMSMLVEVLNHHHLSDLSGIVAGVRLARSRQKMHGREGIIVPVFSEVRGLACAGLRTFWNNRKTKLVRRIRRMRRRLARDSMLISNALLRESVAQYEKQIAIREAVEATQAKIRAGGRMVVLT